MKKARKLCAICDKPSPRRGLRYPVPSGFEEIEIPTCTVRHAGVYNFLHSADIIDALWADAK